MTFFISIHIFIIAQDYFYVNSSHEAKAWEISWHLFLNQKLNDNEYVNLLNDIKQLKTKYNYLYDNDFCDFDYSEEDLKYLLKKELKSNNI